MKKKKWLIRIYFMNVWKVLFANLTIKRWSMDVVFPTFSRDEEKKKKKRSRPAKHMCVCCFLRRYNKLSVSYILYVCDYNSKIRYKINFSLSHSLAKKKIFFFLSKFFNRMYGSDSTKWTNNDYNSSMREIKTSG